MRYTTAAVATTKEFFFTHYQGYLEYRNSYLKFDLLVVVQIGELFLEALECRKVHARALRLVRCDQCHKCRQHSIGTKMQKEIDELISTKEGAERNSRAVSRNRSNRKRFFLLLMQIESLRGRTIDSLLFPIAMMHCFLLRQHREAWLAARRAPPPPRE